MNGEHVRGRGPRKPLSQRVLKVVRSQDAKHRPRLGAMSTSLLDDLLSDHLDKGYVEAADRKLERARRGDQIAESGLRRRLLLALGLLLAGFLLAAAYRATTTQAPESERTRQALLKDVQQGSAT